MVIVLTSVGRFLPDLFEAALGDPSAVLVLLVIVAAAFGAGVDARKRWKEKGWSLRTVWNLVVLVGFLVAALAWAIWLAGTAGD